MNFAAGLGTANEKEALQTELAKAEPAALALNRPQGARRELQAVAKSRRLPEAVGS